MRSKLMYFFAGALVAVLSSAATWAIDAKPAIKKGTLVNLTAEDYVEIMQLENYYTRDVGPGAVRNGAWKFSKDARALIQPGRPLTKPEDFEKQFGELLTGLAAKGGSRKFMTSPVILDCPTARRAAL
jgi:hypothetical protein